MGGGALLFCPPEIIQFKLLYSTYWSILFMNDQSKQKLIIHWCLNEIYKHKTSVPEDFSKIMLPMLLDKNLFEPVIFITPDDKIYH